MARKIIVTQADWNAPCSRKPLPTSRHNCRGRQKETLTCFDDFGLAGPLMVVGEETPLQSGAVDLAGLTRAGDLIILEFKTGSTEP